jgi:peptidoglycan L-alanyl-D-glutamate endopeptidase CwlK
MISRDPEDLEETIRKLYYKFKEEAEKRGITFIVTNVLRTPDVQLALYAQGRRPLSEVNELREKAGLPPITQKENRIVTWTLNSKHVAERGKSRAFDIAVLREGKPSWDVKVNVNKNEVPDYEELGEIGESLGLKWGGRWKKPDYPHFEI